MPQGPFLRKYGVQTTINFTLFEVDGVDLRVDAADAGSDCSIMKDEGAEATCTNDFVDEGQGYSLVLDSTEMSAARIVVYVVDSAAKVWLDDTITIETYGNASAMHAFDLDTATVNPGADGITAANIADDAISSEHINTGAFTADAFAADAIVAATLATGALTADAFAADAIVAATLATGALTADAFAADAIVAATLATDAISADAMADNAITAGTLAGDAITAAKIADDAISSEHINTGAFTADAFAADAIVAATLATGALTADAFAADAIVAATLATDAISADALDADAAAEIVDAWETQSQADPTGFHVNVLEVGGTAQTANDNGADINAILTDTNELQGDWANGGRLDLILDATLAMLDDARSEPAQGAPAVNADAMTKLDYLYKAWRNKSTQDATTLEVYNDAGAVVDHKATVSDDGTDYTKGEIGTGP